MKNSLIGVNHNLEINAQKYIKKDKSHLKPTTMLFLFQSLSLLGWQLLGIIFGANGKEGHTLKNNFVFSAKFSITLVFILGNSLLFGMGLIYTKLYIDFDPKEWKQISNDPITFECKTDNVSLEIMDTSQNSRRLNFKKGGKINLLRVVGKFRLTWNDDDLVSFN